MTSSPDLITELRASRPAAPTALRARVRGIAARETPPVPWPRFRIPARRAVLVAIPAAAALLLASAGVLGIARSDVTRDAVRAETLADASATEAAPSTELGKAAQDSAIGPVTGRAQRVSATLTVEVRDADAVSRAAQEALDLIRSLDGHVVSASVATGAEGNAALTVRVPVEKVQEAIVGLSALGRIVSQQVTIEDLQERLDELEEREASVRAEIARVRARLGSESLAAQTRATLRARLQTLRNELRELTAGIAATSAEAEMSTIQLTIVTPGAFGAVAPPPSRIDRTLDEALNVLAWEAVIALAVLIVLAPVALVAVAAWLGRRLYRRREEERLLAA